MCVFFFKFYFIFMCHMYASYMFFISYTYLIILSHFMYSINLMYLFNRRVANRNKQTNIVLNMIRGERSRFLY